MNDKSHTEEMMDMVTIGERGQIVIPAPIREHYGLKAGDKLMVLSKGEMIGLIPSSKFRSMIAKLTDKLSQLESESANELEDK